MEEDKSKDTERTEPVEQVTREEEPKPVKDKASRNLGLAFKIVGAVVAFILLLPFLLYIPGIQTWVTEFAVEKVEEATGFDINIGNLYLNFPLELSVHDFEVIDDKGDTMVVGEKALVDVRILPLAMGDVIVRDIELKNSKYFLTSEDSSMKMNVGVKHVVFKGTKVELLTSCIKVKDATLSGADVSLIMDQRYAVEKQDTASSSADWLIDLNKLKAKDIRFRMEMMPTIDSLDVELPNAEINSASINLATSVVTVGGVSIDSLVAAYFYPSADSANAYLAQCRPDTVPASVSGEDWFISADSLRVRNTSAVYAMDSAVAADGLDMNYIQVGNVNIFIDNFRNKGANISVPIRDITAEERSGIGIKSASGVFEMNDTAMLVQSFDLKTLMSELKVDAELDSRIFSGRSESKAYMDLQSSVSLEEVGKMFPLLRPQLQAISRTHNAEINVHVDGDGSKLDVKKMEIEVPRIIDLRAEGDVRNLSTPKKTGGKIKLYGKLTGGALIANAVKLDESLRVPIVELKGFAEYRNNQLDADLDAFVDSAKVVLSADWNMLGEDYGGSLLMSGFDVRSFMPRGPVGIVDGDVLINGDGYDIYTMTAGATAKINSIELAGKVYNDIVLDCAIEDGQFELAAVSPNELASLDMTIRGTIAKSAYSASFDGSVNRLDLKRLGFFDDAFNGNVTLAGDFSADLENKVYSGNVAISDLDLIMGKNSVSSDAMTLDLMSDSVKTDISLKNNDFTVAFYSPSGLDAWIDSLSVLGAKAMTALGQQKVEVRNISKSMPQFKMSLDVGIDNVVCQYLAGSGIEFGKISAKAGNADDIYFDADVYDLKSGSVEIDSLCFAGSTSGDSLNYKLHVGNRLKNAQLFKTADLNGSLFGNTLTTYLSQTDKAGAKGFDLGARLSLADSVARMELFPLNPIIAFKNWTLNGDNFIEYDFTDRSVGAKLLASTGDGSLINIYTDNLENAKDGINIDLAGIQLREWLTLSPFAPPIDGVLASNMKLHYNDKYVWGNGKIFVDEFNYGRKRVGDIGFDARLAYVGSSQKVFAYAGMDIDGRSVAVAKGSVGDSLQAKFYNMDIKVDRLPLGTANAFLPKSFGHLSGYLNSSMKFKGTMDNPDIDGYVNFDSTKVALSSYGAKFSVDTTKIPFDGGTVSFNKFDLYGANGRPITVDGKFRVFPFDNMYSNLTIKGHNVQIIDAKKTSSSEVFGKGFADINTRVKGYMNQLDVFANLSILSGSDVTYVMQSSIAAVTESASNDVVEFVEFKDLGKTVNADTVSNKPFAMKINAILNLQPNAKFAVYLSPDGKDRVNINGEGTLNYSQSYQGDARMTGRYEISDGYVRYNIPMLGEKKFDFVDGGSAVWTGDLLNPTLNVKAIDKVKANVTTNDNSRMVPFEVSLNVGNTLSKLDITFDLATTADMTIANELSGMTKEQRSTQAMNLLLYGSYSGGSTKTASNLSGENMAFSFLESSLNKWAANNISGVQLSFGIDQYDKTTEHGTSTTTSYSYQVSKSLWSDRFTISVGGSYSTDASAQDNLSQNLFNDVSFEYKLNKSGSAVFKLFRKTEYESILEGEITEMGGGFVWKRKISSFRDIFRVFKKEKQPKILNDRTRVLPDAATNKKETR